MKRMAASRSCPPPSQLLRMPQSEVIRAIMLEVSLFFLHGLWAISAPAAGAARAARADELRPVAELSCRESSCRKVALRRSRRDDRTGCTQREIWAPWIPWLTFCCRTRTWCGRGALAGSWRSNRLLVVRQQGRASSLWPASQKVLHDTYYYTKYRAVQSF